MSLVLVNQEASIPPLCLDLRGSLYASSTWKTWGKYIWTYNFSVYVCSNHTGLRALTSGVVVHTDNLGTTLFTWGKVYLNWKMNPKDSHRGFIVCVHMLTTMCTDTRKQNWLSNTHSLPKN